MFFVNCVNDVCDITGIVCLVKKCEEEEMMLQKKKAQIKDVNLFLSELQQRRTVMRSSSRAYRSLTSTQCLVRVPACLAAIKASD